MAEKKNGVRTLRPRHQEEIKAKIQTSQLINRLQNHAHGQIEMTATQIDAAKFLINKTVSNSPTITDNKTDVNMTGEIKINVNFD